MHTKTPLQDMTELDLIADKEVPPVPYDHPAWAGFDYTTKYMIELGNSYLVKHRTLAIMCRNLYRENEALRAERDMLLAKIEGRTPTAH